MTTFRQIVTEKGLTMSIFSKFSFAVDTFLRPIGVTGHVTCQSDIIEIIKGATDRKDPLDWNTSLCTTH